MVDEPPGTFTASNQSLGDADCLDSAFREDGYLFFREILDPAMVLEVLRDFLRVLQDQGIVRPGASEAHCTGEGLAQINDEALYGLESHVELIESKAMRRLMERVFGGPVFLFKGTNIRYALPHDREHLTPPHQDHFFIRGNREFRTVWVPLMDIDRHVGGLAVAAGSHKGGCGNNESSGRSIPTR